MTLVLASASPRRKALLAEAGITFEVVPSDVEETREPGESPLDAALRLARAKSACVATRFPNSVVLGADTIVVLGGRDFGKPASLAEARTMLTALSGREHDVLTGVSLLRLRPLQEEAWVCSTRVRFRELGPETIQRYLELAAPLDKAGAYAIQDHGGMIVAAVEGLVSNVIGLPIEEVIERLDAFRVSPVATGSPGRLYVTPSTTNAEGRSHSSDRTGPVRAQRSR